LLGVPGGGRGVRHGMGARGKLDGFGFKECGGSVVVTTGTVEDAAKFIPAFGFDPSVGLRLVDEREQDFFSLGELPGHAR